MIFEMMNHRMIRLLVLSQASLHLCNHSLIMNTNKRKIALFHSLPKKDVEFMIIVKIRLLAKITIILFVISII